MTGGWWLVAGGWATGTVGPCLGPGTNLIKNPHQRKPTEPPGGGFVINGVFILSWLGSMIVYRVEGFDRLAPTTPIAE
jgi:hypothetical protein